MPRTENQKQKLLLVWQYLQKNTDAEHPAIMRDMISYLEKHGVEAERKSIYHDIQALIDFGMDIETVRCGANSGYYVASRLLELPELKLLVDAVQSSKFLTEKKSMKLIEKLTSLASVHEAGQLRRELVVYGRTKTANESIFYNVDAIYDAISTNRRIRFSYFEWGVDRQRHLRSEATEASPYALCWANENYYLIAHSREHGLTHYRVDKMLQIVPVEQPRCMDSYAELDLATYSKRVFSMFAGKQTMVRLRFVNRLAGVVIDRFGTDAMLIPEDENHFTLTAEIAISPMFLGWVAGFGGDASILQPQSLRERYHQFLQKAIDA